MPLARWHPSNKIGFSTPHCWPHKNETIYSLTLRYKKLPQFLHQWCLQDGVKEVELIAPTVTCVVLLYAHIRGVLVKQSDHRGVGRPWQLGLVHPGYESVKTNIYLLIYVRKTPYLFEKTSYRGENITYKNHLKSNDIIELISGLLYFQDVHP